MLTITPLFERGVPWRRKKTRTCCIVYREKHV